MLKPLSGNFYLRAIAFALAAVPCVGQTTWTNFENRESHSMITEPNGNGLLVFGGATPTTGSNLGGTWMQSAVTGPGVGNWQLLNPTTSPSARSEHAMATLASTDIAIAIVFGGVPLNNETWVWSGDNWSAATAGPTIPSARRGHAMVTDPVRDIIVMFGGFDSTSRNDMWEFDGTLWTQRFPTTSPAARFGHSMTWDEVNNEVVLFGGNGFLSDTWVFDDTASTWIDRTPATSPSGRFGAAMAHHPVSQKVVLFGGLDVSLTALDDTWTWDGTAWQQESPANSPPPRSKHAIAKDPASLNLVVVGGASATGEILTGSWEWTGIDWLPQSPPPSARVGAPMAHGQDDGTDEQTVMFGGLDNQTSGVLGDTWHLQGITWSEVSFSLPLPPLPGPRSHQGLTYDSSRNRTVMFGGRTGPLCTDPATSDTWEWDGTTWLPIAPGTSPPATQGAPLVYDAARDRSVLLAGPETWLYDGNISNWSKASVLSSRWRSAAAYDSNRNRLVIFGGGDEVGFGNLRSDTWEWDGASWALQTPTTSPSERWRHAMVYDAARQTVVLFGGRDPANLNYLNDTWEWDGNNWLQSFPLNSPSARRGHAMTYDSVSNRVVLFGGVGQAGDNDDTWEWDGSNWLLRSPTTIPPARGDAALAFDSTRNRAVLFGGFGGGGYLDDTWEWDGNDWAPMTSTGGTPAARCCHAMAYDSAGAVVLFGGGDDNDSYSDTWTWNGSAWTLIPLASSPPKRVFHTLVRDSGAGRLVLFSGRGGPFNALLSDTWEWDGIGWIERSSGTSPQGRFYASMAYDARRDEVVLFGGQSSACSGTRYDDTWLWNGSGWSKQTPTVSPAARSRARLVFDETRGCVVLFGGNTAAGDIADTWEWDGGEWIQRFPTTSPTPTSDHGMAFDRVRGLTVMFDGNTATWDYGPENAGSIESVPTAAGCLSSLGTTPQIDPLPWAGPWLGEPIEIAVTDFPPGISLMVFGFNVLPVPLPLFVLNSPLCTLDVAPNIIEVVFPVTNPYSSPVMPTDPAALGVGLFVQSATLDSGQPGLPAITSNSLHMILGAK